MFESTSLLVIIALLGLALACFVTMVVILFLASRVLHRPILSFMSLLGNSSSNEDDLESNLPRQPRPDLNAIASRHTFENQIATQQLDPRQTGTARSLNPIQSPLGTRDHRRTDLGPAPDSAPPPLSNRPPTLDKPSSAPFGNPPPFNIGGNPPPLPPYDPNSAVISSPRKRPDRPYRPVDEGRDQMDEVFGGMLDSDGDGDPDM